MKKKSKSVNLKVCLHSHLVSFYMRWPRLSLYRIWKVTETHQTSESRFGTGFQMLPQDLTSTLFEAHWRLEAAATGLCQASLSQQGKCGWHGTARLIPAVTANIWRVLLSSASFFLTSHSSAIWLIWARICWQALFQGQRLHLPAVGLTGRMQNANPCFHLRDMHVYTKRNVELL